jgi:uncharacterized protein YbjT (DUF2867 family)
MFRVVIRFLGAVILLLVLLVAGFALTMRAHFPDTTLEVQANTHGQSAVDDSAVLIFGSSRNTGLEVVKLLRARGDKVTAFVRPTSDRTELEKLGVEFVVGDAMDLQSVQAAFIGHEYRAVFTNIGCLGCELPSDYQGNANIIQSAREAGVQRFIFMTSIGVGDSKDTPPWITQRVLARAMPLKAQAEAELRASGMEYTIIRPGGLRSRPATGNGVLTEETDAFGYIFREDLARLIVACLDDPRAINKTLAALDAQREWPWSE